MQDDRVAVFLPFVNGSNQSLVTGSPATLCVKFNHVSWLRPVHRQFKLYVSNHDRETRVHVDEFITASSNLVGPDDEQWHQCLNHFDSISELNPNHLVMVKIHLPRNLPNDFKEREAEYGFKFRYYSWKAVLFFNRAFAAVSQVEDENGQLVPIQIMVTCLCNALYSANASAD